MGLTGGETSSDHQQHQDWGMGIFFIFFPEDHHDPNSAARKKNPPPLIGSFKRINSTHLLSTAQSTISICALLVFITLLFFTLSTFESSSSSVSNTGRLIQYSSRRQLRNVDNNGGLLKQQKKVKRFPAPAHALQGMGSLYRRGSKSMSDLVVVHVVETLNLHELKLFLRLFFGSTLNSRADLLFLFPAKSVAFDNVILDESESFFKMVAGVNNGSRNSSVPGFLKRSKNDKAAGEPIWGGKLRANSSAAGGNQTESTRVSYGSVVGFDVDELDPENSLAGFMDYHVPMSLRRWACYPMLLGRLRRNFKHIMLVDVKEWVIVGDGMGWVRAGSPETVHLSTVPQAVPARHGKKGSEKAQPAHAKSVSPAVIRGGARGVRRVSQAMLNEIVRATVAKKKKNTVTESGVFNQLVGNEFLLKNVKLITATESLPELSSLATGSYSKNVTVARRGNSNFSVNSTPLKDILCSSPLHNSVYSNCL